MKKYLLLTDYQNLKKDDHLLPVTGYSDPIPFATQSEIDKIDGKRNMWFESYLKERPETFKLITE